MTAPATTPLSYNLYVQQLCVLAVEQAVLNSGVWAPVMLPMQTLLPQALNYAELRIQRDLDFLQARSSNNYPLVAGNNLLQVPINDFLILDTIESLLLNGSTVVDSCPMIQVSREFIQNCYAGMAQASLPRFYAMFGDTFGNGADTNINVLLGPVPNFAYTLRVNGVIRMPTLAQYATSGPADTAFTYISQFLPDMLMMASMIYVSAYQRNFSSTSDDPQMPMSYEKQYQALRLGAISEENRKKGQGSAWSSYSTPVAATPTR